MRTRGVNLKTVQVTVGRRERKRSETREKLFKSALRLFGEKGFASTTVEDITEAADVGKGTFFNYFPTKQHILRHFGEQQVATIEGWFRTASASNKPTKQLMRELVSAATALPATNPELVRAMVGSFVADEEIRAFVKQELAIARAKVAEFVAMAQRRGDVRGDISAPAIARTFQQTIFGAMLFWSLHEDAPLKDYLDSVFEIVWAGMEPMKRSRKQ